MTLPPQFANRINLAIKTQPAYLHSTLLLLTPSSTIGNPTIGRQKKMIRKIDRKRKVCRNRLKSIIKYEGISIYLSGSVDTVRRIQVLFLESRTITKRSGNTKSTSVFEQQLFSYTISIKDQQIFYIFNVMGSYL